MKKKVRLEIELVLILTVVMLAFLFINKLAPFGDRTLAYDDGYYQYLDYFHYFKYQFFQNPFSFYSSGMGLGDDAVVVFTYYLASPFNWLLFVMPIAVGYNIIVCLKLITAGLFFHLFVQKRFPQLQEGYRILFSVCYAMMNYSIAQACNIMWLDGVYMLPLILLGVYKVTQEHRMNKLLIFSAGTAILLNWYSAALDCLFSIFYFFFEVLYQKDSQWLKDMISYGFCMILGVLLSCVLFLPTILSMRDGRGSSMDLAWLNMGFRGNLFDHVANYRPGVMSYDERVSLYASALPFVFSCAFFNNNKDKRQKFVVLGFLILNALFYWWQPLIFLFSLFKKVDSYWYRYSFVSIFFLLWTGAAGAEELKNEKINDKTILLCFSILVLQTIWVCFRKGGIVKSQFVWIAVCVCVIVLLKLGWKKGLAVVTACDLLLSSYGLITTYQRYTSASAYESYAEEKQTEINAIRESDQNEYRIHSISRRGMDPSYQLSAVFNEPLAYGYSSLESYTSDPDNAELVWLEKYGYPSYVHTFNSTVSSLLPVDSFIGIRYIVSPYESSIYGEHEVHLSGKKVYENPYSLPLAFQTESSQVKDGKNPFENINALYSSILGEKVTLYKPALYAKEKNGNSITYIFNQNENTQIYGNIVSDQNMKAELKMADGTVIPYSQWLAPSVFPVSSEKGKKEVSFTMTFVQDAIQEEQFYELDLQELGKVTQEIQSKAAENISWENGHFSCDINQGNGDTVITIPYKQGWIVKVNGETIQPEVFDDLFLLVPVNGKSHIEMQYHTPGIKTGAILSLLTLVLSFIL